MSLAARPTRVEIAILACVVIGSVSPTAAQQPIAYPAKGQSAQQQQKDQGECQAWAKQTTGVDPATVAQAPAPAAQSGPAVGGGERVRGAARGAAGGALVGAIAGDAGEGAAVGAIVGTVAGGVRARRNREAQQQQAQQQHVAQQQGQLSTFNRAFAACMEGRGYTIK
jgi:hypothetical protein